MVSAASLLSINMRCCGVIEVHALNNTYRCSASRVRGIVGLKRSFFNKIKYTLQHG